MILNLALMMLFALGVIGLASLFLIEIYINLFQAEKIRRLIVLQPEYSPGWYILIKSYKPFKWWHFYRKSMFSWLLHWALSGKPDPKSKCECATSRILPKPIKKLYASEMYGFYLSAVSMILFSILNHFS